MCGAWGWPERRAVASFTLAMRLRMLHELARTCRMGHMTNTLAATGAAGNCAQLRVWDQCGGRNSPAAANTTDPASCCPTGSVCKCV